MNGRERDVPDEKRTSASFDLGRLRKLTAP